MAKDLSVFNNYIVDTIQINIILNSLSPSLRMTVLALKTQFGNLNIDQLPLYLKALEENIKPDKNYELMLTQEKPSGNSFLMHPRLFKKKFNRNKLKKDTSFQKQQVNIVKCYKCGKSGHIQRNCRPKHQNNNNRRPWQDNPNQKIICVVSQTTLQMKT